MLSTSTVSLSWSRSPRWAFRSPPRRSARARSPTHRPSASASSSRQTRFEFGAGAGSTVNQDFYHTVMINVRLAFHITDWLSLAGFGDFGVAQIATGFQDKATDSLNDPTGSNVLREPTPTQAKASLQQISSILGAQLESTPFTGKFGMFGKLFAALRLLPLRRRRAAST